MKEMTHRTTFALDQATAGRLKQLSAAWQVSQAEVVRRAVAMAEREVRQDVDAATILRDLHASGRGLVRERAEQYLAQVDQERADWRGGE